MEVYAAINAVQSEMAQVGISKDKKNVQQGYNFRGIDDVYGALAPMLAKHKLCIIPYVLSRNVVERQTKTGGVLFYTTVECEFHFISAVDGSKHIAKTFGEAMDSGDKSTNKAMSAAYKYAAFQTFCIPVDVVDADAETHKDILPKAKKETIADAQPNNAPATGQPPKEVPPQVNVARNDGIEEGLVRIATVTSKEGETNGKKWKAFFITTVTGGNYGTFSETIADLATNYAKEGKLVRLISKPSKKGREVVSIEKINNDLPPQAPVAAAQTPSPPKWPRRRVPTTRGQPTHGQPA